jgi:hypothetical protein
MSKIIKLTESDLINIVKQVLSEQSGPINAPGSEIIQGVGKDPYEYKRERGYYFTRKKGSNKWIKTAGKVSNAIATKIFKDNPLNVKNKKIVKRQKVKPVVQNTQKVKPVVQNTQKDSYKYSPRVDAELQYIKDRRPLFGRALGWNVDKPFFIYDPKFNLLFLFNKDFSLIKSTSVVDGKDAQENTTPFTREDWCKASGLDFKPHVCTNKTTKGKQDPGYWVLNDIAVKFIPKGIYTIAGLSRNSKYAGKGKNVFSLKDSKGQTTAAAIHGMPSGRLTASENLESLLKAEKNNGRVPQEYLDAVDTIIASSNLSYGCVNIPASFVEDPKVRAAVQVGVPVYVMGESEQGYLVQDSSKYFDELNGDGQSCANPVMLASGMGKKLPSETGYENIA